MRRGADLDCAANSALQDNVVLITLVNIATAKVACLCEIRVDGDVVTHHELEDVTSAVKMLRHLQS